MDQTAQNQNSQIPSEIRGFLESLLSEAGMTTLEPSMREEMLNELYVRLDNLLTAKIVDNLAPEDTETFIQMNNDQKSKEEIQQFLTSKMPNVQEVFTKAFMEFRDLYLGNVAVARHAPSEQQPATPTPAPEEARS